MGGRRKRAWETDTHWVTDYPVSREDMLLNSLWGVQRFPRMCLSIRERSVRETGIAELWFASYLSLFPLRTNFSKSKMSVLSKFHNLWLCNDPASFCKCLIGCVLTPSQSFLPSSHVSVMTGKTVSLNTPESPCIHLHSSLSPLNST